MGELQGLRLSAGEQQGQTHTVDLKFDTADVDVSDGPEGQRISIKDCHSRPAVGLTQYDLPRKTFVVTLPEGAVVHGVSISRGEYRELLGRFQMSRSTFNVVEGKPTEEAKARMALAREAQAKEAPAAARARTTAAEKSLRVADTAPVPDLVPEEMIEYRTWSSKEGQRVWVAVRPVRIDRRVDKLVLFSRLRVQIHYEVK